MTGGVSSGLSGRAGTGRSTMARTIACEYYNKGCQEQVSSSQEVVETLPVPASLLVVLLLAMQITRLLV